MNTSNVERFVTEWWDERIVPTLCDYVRIPNKSPAFDPEWEAHGHMERAVELLEQWALDAGVQGLSTDIVRLPGRTPLLLAEVASTGAPGTVLLYGHYDKQPEFEGWDADLGPWEPVLRDGRLYGRGGADDGYALFGSLTAIAALQAEGTAHGRCVLLIEGCEESGSYDLPFYVEALRDRIGDPGLVVCLDAECGNYEQLWVTTSLRGMLPGVLSVEVLSEGQHSGAAGGIVPSSFRLLRQLMERVEDAASGRLHPALYVDIPDDARRQLGAVAEVLGDRVTGRFPWLDGVQPEAGDTRELLLNNAWRPSLATVGLGGAPDVSNAGNTLRPGTRAKLVFRLPPTLDAAAAAAAIRTELERDPPHGARVRFALETPQTGWKAPAVAPWLDASLQRASRAFFRAPAMYMGMGGTIPFMKMLGDAYPATQFLVTGVLGPKSNAHGPDAVRGVRVWARRRPCRKLTRANGGIGPVTVMRRLYRDRWRPYFEWISNLAARAPISVEIGDARTETEPERLVGLGYDADADALALATESSRQVFTRPADVYLTECGDTLTQIEIVLADRARKRIRLKQPLPFPPLV